MINKNTYKAKKKNIILFFLLLILGIILFISSINLRFFIKSEIETAQRYFVTFSSFRQLFDSGNIEKFSDIKRNDILPAGKKIFNVIYEGLTKNKNTKLDNIS